MAAARTAFTALPRFDTAGGQVLRALRSDEPDFYQVEEAYFSKLNPKAIRAWKYHREMTVNVVVPIGHVRFVVHEPQDSDDSAQFKIFDLGPDHDYGRLRISSATWFGFQAGDLGGLVLNLADCKHDDDEALHKDLDCFPFDWNSQS